MGGITELLIIMLVADAIGMILNKKRYGN